MNAENIPIIDIDRLSEPETIKAIDKGLAQFGFLYIRNHGVSKELQNSILHLSQRFFAENINIKMKVAMQKSGIAWRGYFPLKGELTSGKPDQKEGLYFGNELPKSLLPLHGPNQWPDGQEYIPLKQNVLDYMSIMTKLSQKLLDGVGLGLGLPKDYFRNRFTSEPTTLLRIFNYPKHRWEDSKDEWGVREHTDMGFLTILLQDAGGGLQIKTLDGQWIAAPPIDGTFVVNIGDMLEVWTHGIYRATPHRVRNQGVTDRISIPFFFDPNWNCTLEPISASLLDSKRLKTLQTQQRWDGLNLSELTGKITYGEFVWNKVKKVFPELK